MATNIDEAIQEAIAEIKLDEWVVDAEADSIFSEDKPCNYVRKRLNVMHETLQGGYTYSTKELYINKGDFTYKWHYGGATTKPAPTPVKDFLESKIPDIMTAMSLDHLEIVSVDEEQESAIILAVKGTTGANADTYTVKAWKTETTPFYEYKIIDKTTVS